MPANPNPMPLRADRPGGLALTQRDILRPAVVVEDEGLFAPNYPNAILVPLTEDATLAIADLSVPIEPAAENGCSKPCVAVSHLVAATSKAGIRATPLQVTPSQLAQIRRQIALAIGAV
jgi:mRNA interferase MazF